MEMPKMEMPKLKSFKCSCRCKKKLDLNALKPIEYWITITDDHIRYRVQKINSGFSFMGKQTWRMTGFGNVEQKASKQFEDIKFDNYEIVKSNSHESHK